MLRYFGAGATASATTHLEVRGGFYGAQEATAHAVERVPLEPLRVLDLDAKQVGGESGDADARLPAVMLSKLPSTNEHGGTVVLKCVAQLIEENESLD